MNGIANGDLEVINFLYSEYFQSIRHLIVSNSGSEDDARDVFQEVLIVFFRKLKLPDFSLISSLKTYLYSVARLIWLKELEHRKKFENFEETGTNYLTDDKDLPDLIERNERMRLYREKFEELSEDCKRVLRMFLNNIPIKEITRLMGYSSDQHTKNRRFRCKLALINKIRASNKYQELSYGKNTTDRSIPRW